MAVDVRTFWYRIDLLREAKGMTLVELQDRIGCRGAYIYSIKSRNILPGLDYIWKIADVFGCSIDYLLGREDTPVRKNDDNGEMKKIISRLVADDKFFNIVSSMMTI